MILHDCEQGSPEWFKARAGIPTASAFADVLAKGEGKVRRAYMMKLAGERLTGQPMDNYTNQHFDRGKAMEAEARSAYELVTDAEVASVGFIEGERAGASPDGLIGKSGVLEVKTKLPHLLIESLLRGDFPPEHKAQCQGALWVAEREWIDIAIYWPGLPLVTYRAGRDAAYIEGLAAAIRQFNSELDDVVERVRRYGAGGTPQTEVARMLKESVSQ